MSLWRTFLVVWMTAPKHQFLRQECQTIRLWSFSFMCISFLGEVVFCCRQWETKWDKSWCHNKTPASFHTKPRSKTLFLKKQKLQLPNHVHLYTAKKINPWKHSLTKISLFPDYRQSTVGDWAITTPWVAWSGSNRTWWKYCPWLLLISHMVNKWASNTSSHPTLPKDVKRWW